MAIIHRAELKPSKIELITAWLDHQSWGGRGELSAIGAYRYDDPDGEVGVEGHLVARDGVLLHVPLTYRAAPLDDPDAVLVGQLSHSVLGERFVYDATTDPVAVGCFARALRGRQQPAVWEIHDGATVVGRREPTVVISVVDGDGKDSTGGAIVPLGDGAELRVARVLESDDPHGSTRMVATWGDGSAVVAALS
jgi:hypothetical protein